jgi:tight adherence protein C
MDLDALHDQGGNLMDIIVIAGAVAVVGSVLLVWWLVSSEKTASLDLGHAGTADDLRVRQLQQSASDRLTKPGLERLGQVVRGWTPTGRVTKLEKQLASAGSPVGWSVDRLLAVKLLLAVGLAGFVLLLVDFTVVGMLLVLLGGAAGFMVPDVLLQRRIDQRNTAVRRELADVVDQVSMMVQAGLGIDAALVRAARSSEGPIADELTRVGQDVRVGIERSVALAAMAERVDVAELRTVVAALAQAERLGSPVSQTLEIQAHELRLKRRQHAEEQALKLPVKLLFPMVFCILPVLMIVVLAPAVIGIMDNLG